VRKSKDRPHQRILLAGLLFLVIGILISGCHKQIQITVSPEDILRANEASREADIAFARKDFYAALIKYLESVRLNPNSEYVYNKLGITYSQLKYFEPAEAAFVHSIEINPKYPYSYNNLGSVYFALENFKKAEKYFKKAISLKEDEASFHMNMSSLHQKKKRDDKAKAEWRRAVSLDPNVLSKNVSVSLMSDSVTMMQRQYFLARMLASAGDVQAVIKHLELAISNGFTDIDSIRKEPDFDGIRKDPSFVDFIENAGLLIRLRSKVGLPEEPKKKL
jgi:tetratricopeptide (TPR) repeat protein